MEIAAALTIWAMFSCYLLFHVMGLPVLMPRTAMTLLVAELLALAVWSYGSENCVERPCGAAAETARDAAALDVPLMAGLFVLVTMMGGVKAARRQTLISSDCRPSPAAGSAAPGRRRTPDPRRASRPPAAPR